MGTVGTCWSTYKRACLFLSLHLIFEAPPMQIAIQKQVIYNAVVNHPCVITFPSVGRDGEKWHGRETIYLTGQASKEDWVGKPCHPEQAVKGVQRDTDLTCQGLKSARSEGRKPTARLTSPLAFANAVSAGLMQLKPQMASFFFLPYFVFG